MSVPKIPTIDNPRFRPTAASPEAAQAAQVAAPAPPSHQGGPGKRRTVWNRMGGGSLSISLIVHAVLLCLGVFWIFQIMPEKKTDVDFMPKGGGGGSPGVKEISNKKQRPTMSMPNAPRMAAKGATSSFSLPAPDAASTMSAVGALSAGGLSGGLGGGGSGGGRGDGNGRGFGSGSGPGLGGGAAGANPFGILNPNANHLIGNIYDFYQTSDGKPSKHPQNGTAYGTNNLPWLSPLVTDYIEGGWNDVKLRPYFKGPATLGITQMLIPLSKDHVAPEAFGAAGKMTGGAWIAVYRGTVRAPESGDIRFLGTADNFLAVRMNNRNVITFGCGNKPSPFALGTLRIVNVTGQWFRINEGSSYDMSILIGDAGGSFSASLLYERKTEPGKYYLFRTEASDFAPILAKDVNDLPRNIEVNSPVWPCTAARPGI